MRTDDLIGVLAADAAPIDPRVPRRRFVWIAAAATAAAAALMLILLGINPRLAEYTRLPMFWVKLGFGAAVAVAAAWAMHRLARPGVPLGVAPWAAFAPFALVWALGTVSIWVAAPGERMDEFFGSSWTVCPFYIALLAAPAWVGGLYVMRTMAPTRPALAGAAAGLWAGGLGTFVYALHCPELAPAFIASWYALGVLILGVLGAAFGARLLRW